MALFQRSVYGDEPGFTNLFRMLDAFENYHGQTPRGNSRQSRLRSFSPKFDVRETEKSYELHGELPGIERQDLHIDFTEPQTVVISGHVERNYSSNTPPAGLEDKQTTSAITEGSDSSHHATVSDEETEVAKEQGTSAADEVAKSPEESSPQPQGRFWHQERSVGQFHRTFTFPVPVDESATKANLNNGVLHVSIPKAAKRQNRRIDIE